MRNCLDCFDFGFLSALEVKTGDVENAFLTAPVAEKMWTVLGPNCGMHQGKKANAWIHSMFG